MFGSLAGAEQAVCCCKRRRRHESQDGTDCARYFNWSVFSLSSHRTLAQTRTGFASVYSTESGSKTASGQKLNPAALTAAHRSLPLGSKVTVTNKSIGRSVVMTINDRGPFMRGRVIDVSPAAARALGFSGLTHVSLRTGD
jgi:rare lipoprotein A